jgi:hypothetical protein
MWRWLLGFVFETVLCRADEIHEELDSIASIRNLMK